MAMAIFLWQIFLRAAVPFLALAGVSFVLRSFGVSPEWAYMGTAGLAMLYAAWKAQREIKRERDMAAFLKGQQGILRGREATDPSIQCEQCEAVVQQMYRAAGKSSQ